MTNSLIYSPGRARVYELPAPERERRHEAAEELLRRRRSRIELTSFCTYINKGYLVEPVHRAIADILMSLLDTENRRVIITAPPQVGKSYLTSRLFPAFYLAHRPDNPIILSSYGASLAEVHCAAARDIVEGESFHRLFPDVKVDRQYRSKHSWRVEDKRGGMLGVGVQGPVTGHGAMLGIIDDPFENWKQASSEVMRNHAWDWWLSTFRSRIWNGGNVVMVLTRWHEDDLAGRALLDTFEKWEIHRFPALAESQHDRDEINKAMNLPVGEPDPLGREEGESLAPIRQPAERLRVTRDVVGDTIWSALYQGFPRMPLGQWFTTPMFPISATYAGPVIRRVRYWDKAAVEGGGKFSVGVRIAVMRLPDVPGVQGFRFKIEDVVRGQWSAETREDIIYNTCVTDPMNTLTYIEQEPGSSGKESAESTIARAKLAGRVVVADKVSGGNKDVRLIPFHSACERNAVDLLPGVWNIPYITEMIALPTGKYRDQGDGTSGAFNKAIEGMYNPYTATTGGSRDR